MSTAASPRTCMLEFGGFTVPAGCRRIFITAELEPSNGDPRIQPTGFPDIGPVMYPDPSREQGLICLVESEASMANRLEEVCLADKYTGELRAELKGLPYIKLSDTGLPDGQLITASTIDGHRFASEYIMRAVGNIPKSSPAEIKSFGPATQSGVVNDSLTKKGKRQEKETKAEPQKPEFVAFVKKYLGMTTSDKCPAASVPNIFVLAMEYDPLSLIHGFQISVKDKLTFVGLRSPRALTASIVASRCERVMVPGVRLDPVGTGDAGQAIFQKQRITAGNIQVRFSIDVGLLASLRLDCSENHPLQAPRLQLLLAIALWKTAMYLSGLKIELSLRTECKLKLQSKPEYRADGTEPTLIGDFPYESISNATLDRLISEAQFKEGRSPLWLKFEKRKDDNEMKDQEAEDSGGAESETSEPAEE